ncbi:GNAT family N-acetyltransferase [Peptoniphilus stercorisuis]|uniref:ElaA protein n=1 Tax=Peptoniphilus stercorisuis TaxID=1436965 RepID=A0ABS4KCQ2_9FIRM|nr:GNAT family N-acetyltransferase [Peptoniphilus stercorisuis]MBP2025540.1 ElaA protein [Peptoniphilus stercorisuis]
MKIYNKNYNELTKDELYNILRLRNQIFIVEQKCYYEDIDNLDKDSIHIFKKENDNIISYLRIFKEDGNYHMGRVLVKEENRKNGLSRKLLKYAIEYIFNELKEEKIIIEAQDYLKEFYKSMGFVEKSEVYLLDNIPHLIMELNK